MLGTFLQIPIAHYLSAHFSWKRTIEAYILLVCLSYPYSPNSRAVLQTN